MTWGWPEWTMAVLYALYVVMHTVAAVKDKRKSSEMATLSIFAAIGWTAVVCFVLHEGGFW